ncbi:glycosyltransferase [Roseomonas marmotae]|uniref:Glycosyltransferase family 2 protein n=1 Tax=Roseomonas marmotae TaxID=2768161 RepID=A0ABS3KCZ4_9PROT|nr:glycosyltransferase family 2 protein [Roseomonas marmotae]MBO1075310.1 glycosyltransferase family 2 protein [Roseomonas marmotae]QTI78289.1 glycosyltransferase family 2 protein [Roseomonas marmotae]
MPPLLTIVVPCFNEAENVVPMAERLDAALRGIAWEVIFVDDDSPDGTAAIARGLAARDDRIRCIRRIGRRGLASACIEGMLASSAPYVAVIDGDLQHDETILPKMLRALQAGQGDVAIGSRHVAGGGAAEGFSPLRQRISEGGTALARAVLPVRVEDPMSGYFMLPRDVFEELAPRLTGRGFKILVDILLSAKRKLRVVEVPYAFRPRVAGDSKLDTTVLLEFVALLLDKALGGLLPLRFLSFALVGAIGLVVHLVVLAVAIRFVPFVTAQWTATFVAMTANFVLNNRITYRDVKLRGPALWRGLILFYVVCGLGAAANVGVASLLLRDDLAAWRWAGAAGALLTGVWNYAVSSTLVWRAR